MQEKDIHLPSVYRIPGYAETVRSGIRCAAKVPQFEAENYNEEDQSDFEYLLLTVSSPQRISVIS